MSVLVAILTGLMVESAMSQAAQPLPIELELLEESDRVTVVLVTQAEVSQRISYTLEMKGKSSSTHKSSSMIHGGERTEISRMSMNVGENWCARLEVTRQDGSVYAIVRGPCRD